MIGFLGAALIVAILLICGLGSFIFAIVCLLAGKGKAAAMSLMPAFVSSGLLFLILREVMP
ncbi:hypothetical protein [Hoeflea sp.]|uniref:hypothetical protein n=1 Tax=Hoeflea sp. TaxID=1940281 RepID=UPI003BB15D64